MPPIQPPVAPTPPPSHDTSFAKWLGTIASSSILAFVGATQYTIGFALEAESLTYRIVSFIASFSLYVALLSSVAFIFVWAYRQKTHSGGVVSFGKQILIKSLLYVVLPSLLLTAIVIIWAISSGTLDTSELSFW